MIVFLSNRSSQIKSRCRHFVVLFSTVSPSFSRKIKRKVCRGRFTFLSTNLSPRLVMSCIPPQQGLKSTGEDGSLEQVLVMKRERKTGQRNSSKKEAVSIDRLSSISSTCSSSSHGVSHRVSRDVTLPPEMLVMLSFHSGKET